jgi:hypothetical protein
MRSQQLPVSSQVVFWPGAKIELLVRVASPREITKLPVAKSAT